MTSPPSPQRRQRAQHLFEEVARLGPSARAARLQAVEDTVLRAEVEDLLGRSSGEPAPPSGALRAGMQVGRYRLIEELGRGGMGVVFRAEDARLGRYVALKVLPAHLTADAAARERLLTEARAAAALDHPNLCTIYEAGETETGRLFIAMACYEGETLERRLARGPLAVNEALALAQGLVRGLGAVHARGIVHRDLKPSNVFLTEAGTPKLLDFGIAKVAGGALTQPGRTLGTVEYMAPEQLRGEVDERADLWALGAVLYEALTGRRPFRAEYEAALLYAILHEDPEPVEALRPEVPPPLAAVIERCLEKDPEARYASAAAVAADLEAALRPEAIERVPPSSRRWSVFMASAAGAGVAVLLLLLSLIPSVRTTTTDWLGLGGVEIRRFAVLPLVGVGEGSELSAGLTLTLTSLLTQMGQYAQDSVVVVPASETQRVHEIEEARTRFGVSETITGDVRLQGGRVHLTLNRVDARRLQQLGTRPVSVSAQRVAALPGVLVDALADLLDLRLTPETRALLVAGGTASDEAYRLFLEGRKALEGYEQEENVDTAIRLFHLALDEDSTYAQAAANLCIAYVNKYEATAEPAWIQQAEQSCERALRLDDRLAVAHTGLGHVLLKTGATETAVTEYQLALALDSTSTGAYLGLAKAYAALGRNPAAEAHFRRAIAQRPDWWSAYNDFGSFYYEQGRFEEAAALFRQAAGLDPDNAWPLNNLGGAYAALGRLEEARKAFEGVLALGPDYSAYSNLGILYFHEGRYEDEARMYEQALSIDSSDYLVWGNLGAAYERTEADPAQVRRTYERAAALTATALDVNPTNVEVLLAQALYLLELGQVEAARASLDRALATGAVSTLLIPDVLVLLERMGDRNNALIWARRGLEQGLALEDLEAYSELDALLRDPRFVALTLEMEALEGR